MTEIVEWIRKRLDERNWNVAELCRQMDAIARMSGMGKGPSNQAIQSILRGKTGRPEEATLRLIALAFREPPEDLLKLAGYPVHPPADTMPEVVRRIWQHYEAVPRSVRGVAFAILDSTDKLLVRLIRSESLEGPDELHEPPLDNESSAR